MGYAKRGRSPRREDPVSTRDHLGAFPPTDLDWAAFVPHIGRAQAALARYDALSLAVPNVRLLLAPLIVQEAVLSSKIEGTQVTMGEVLAAEAEGGAAELTFEKRAGIKEVRSYRVALGFVTDAIAERPLSEQLLRETHAVLVHSSVGIVGIGFA
jgi:Fic family protein